MSLKRINFEYVNKIFDCIGDKILSTEEIHKCMYGENASYGKYIWLLKYLHFLRDNRALILNEKKSGRGGRKYIWKLNDDEYLNQFKLKC